MRRWLLTAGGLGRSPVMPGTAGTLAAVPLVWALARYAVWPALWCVVLAAGLAVLLAAWSGWIARAYGQGDPHEVVLDEVAGYLVAAGWSLAWQPAAAWPYALAAAFVLFRMLDMMKPFPIDLFERIPRWGIVADDLLAGAIAGAVIGVLPLGALV